MSSLVVDSAVVGAQAGERTHRYLNVRLPESTHDLLLQYCKVAGQTKTTAVDRALQAYCAEQLEKLVDL